MDNGLYLMITPYPGHGLKIKTSSGTIMDTDSIESDSILGEFYSYLCFVHPIFVFGFWSRLRIKLRKYYVIFVYILQGKMGETEKKRKENHATIVTKIPKTKICDE